MVKFKEDKGKFSLDLFFEEFSPSIKVVFIHNVQFGYGEAIDMSFNVEFILFNKITKVVDLSITQEDNGSIFGFEDEWLI